MARVFLLGLIFGLMIVDGSGLPIIFIRPGGLAGYQQGLPNPTFGGGQRLLFKRSGITLRDIGEDSDLIDRMNMDDLSELLLRLASANGILHRLDILPNSNDNVVMPKGQLRVQRRTPLSDSQSMKLSELMSGSNTGLLSRPGK
uniref:Uncharacterized protein n=1 Tax=Panagrellus redivivus TaxID=6233 RepID=A0A7E4W6Z3_PANRE